MIKYNGKKLTPNEYAKYLIVDKGENASYWQEDHNLDCEPSEKEIQAIYVAIDRHLTRVSQFLGINKIYKKILD